MPDREFYVGYLKLPPGIKRFLFVLVPLLLIGATALGVVIVARQDDPGNGQWHMDELTQLSIIVEPLPYPMFLDDDGAVLLVAEGKHQFAVTTRGPLFLKGHWITRDGYRLFEVVEGNARSASRVDVLAPPATPVSLGPYHGAGQIVDPKCYLGVMRPGEGKVHKACATVCIKGGIPPMFKDDATGELYLLTDAAGHAILDPIVPYIADPIEVTGQLEQLADLKILKLDVASIRRVE